MMSPQIAAGQPTAIAPQSPASEAIESAPPDVVEGLAALAGAPSGIAELAFNAFPPGTRAWLLTYGLASEQGDGTLQITSLGREAIEFAAPRCPEPYADISLQDLKDSTNNALAALVAGSGAQVKEPRVISSYYSPRAAGAIRRSGRHFAERLQGSVGRAIARVPPRSRAGRAAQSGEPAER